jgi:hypothetical protein
MMALVLRGQPAATPRGGRDALRDNGGRNRVTFIVREAIKRATSRAHVCAG